MKQIRLKDLMALYDDVVVVIPGHGERECHSSEVKPGEIVELPKGTTVDPDDEQSDNFSEYDLYTVLDNLPEFPEDATPEDVVDQMLDQPSHMTERKKQVSEDDQPRPSRKPFKFHAPLDDARANQFVEKLNDLIKALDPSSPYLYASDIEELQDGSFFVTVINEENKRWSSYTVKIEWNGPLQPIPTAIISKNTPPSNRVKSTVLWQD